MKDSPGWLVTASTSLNLLTSCWTNYQVCQVTSWWYSLSYKFNQVPIGFMMGFLNDLNSSESKCLSHEYMISIECTKGITHKKSQTWIPERVLLSMAFLKWVRELFTIVTVSILERFSRYFFVKSVGNLLPRKERMWNNSWSWWSERKISSLVIRSSRNVLASVYRSMIVLDEPSLGFFNA